LQDELPVRLDDKGDVASSFRISYSIVGGGQDFGLIELFPSPWNRQTPVLFVSAPGPEAFAPLGSVLGSAWGNGDLFGNVALVYSGNKIHSYVVPMSRKVTSVESPSVQLGRGWLWFAISLAGFALAIILLMRLRRSWEK